MTKRVTHTLKARGRSKPKRSHHKKLVLVDPEKLGLPLEDISHAVIPMERVLRLRVKHIGTTWFSQKPIIQFVAVDPNDQQAIDALTGGAEGQEFIANLVRDD